MKTIYRLLCTLLICLFMYSFGNKPVKEQPEVTRQEISKKIVHLSDTLMLLRDELSETSHPKLDSLIEQKYMVLQDMQERLVEAGEAEFFVTRVNYHQIEVWTEELYDSLVSETP